MRTPNRKTAAESAQEWWRERPSVEQVICERCWRVVPPCHFPCESMETIRAEDRL